MASLPAPSDLPELPLGDAVDTNLVSPRFVVWRTRMGTVGRLAERLWTVVIDANILQLAAAIAFFTLLAAGPLVIVLLSIVGLVFGDDAAQGRLFGELRSLTGADGARMIEDIVERSRQGGGGFWAFSGSILFLWSAGGIFSQVSQALDTIRRVAAGRKVGADEDNKGPRWRQAAKSGWRVLRDRLVSMAMVLFVSVLLVVAILASSIISALTNTFDAWIDRAVTMMFANFAISSVMLTALTTALYGLLTRPPLPRMSAALGGMVAAGLFLMLRWLVGLVVPLMATETSFGSAASVVTLLLWAWFSAVTMLLGGSVAAVHDEFTGDQGQLSLLTSAEKES